MFEKYEQLTLNKPCQTCWSDKVKVFNYFNKMAKKIEPTLGEKSYKFKAGFENTEIHLAGRMSPIKSEDLNENISLIMEIPSLMELVELV